MDVARSIDCENQILIHASWISWCSMFFCKSSTSYKYIKKLQRTVVYFKACLTFKLTKHSKICPSPNFLTLLWPETWLFNSSSNNACSMVLHSFSHYCVGDDSWYLHHGFSIRPTVNINFLWDLKTTIKALLAEVLLTLLLAGNLTLMETKHNDTPSFHWLVLAVCILMNKSLEWLYGYCSCCFPFIMLCNVLKMSE